MGYVKSVKHVVNSIGIFENIALASS